MNCYDRLQRSVDYIESNLKEDIDIRRIAEKAGFSLTHFYRVFQAAAGESIKCYVQKRRLSNAAVELITSDKRLIDIAFDYGFHSQEVFTRAFLKEFGITPGKYRNQKQKIVLFEKVNIRYKGLQNASSLVYKEPQILLNKEFRLVGMQRIVKPGQASIAKLWNEFMGRKCEITDTLNDRFMLGLCEYTPDITDDSEFNYMACVEVSNDSHVPNEMSYKMIPLSKYAVFTHDGSLAGLRNTYDFIYGIWFPESGYELSEQDTIELYQADENKFDIYIPVRGKGLI